MNDLLKESRDELSAVSDKLFVEIYEQGYNAGLTARKENGCAFCNIGDAIRGLAERLRVPEKPANQKRSDLIERAKEFVAEHGEGFEIVIYRPERIVLVWNIFYKDGVTYTHIGKAECNPSDVFNEQIGKAIALARALDIDIPQDFLEAVQPDEFVFGVAGRWTRNYDGKTFEASIDSDNPENDLYTANKDLNSNYTDWSATIIDDTNAEYETKNEGETK